MSDESWAQMLDGHWYPDDLIEELLRLNGYNATADVWKQNPYRALRPKSRERV